LRDVEANVINTLVLFHTSPLVNGIYEWIEKEKKKKRKREIKGDREKEKNRKREKEKKRKL
jgi:hypothetical protein